MTDPQHDERERIREQKRQELQQRLENGGELGADDGPSTPSEPLSIEGHAHLEDVVDEHDVVLVDCYADWCGPCQMLEPTIESLAEETDAAVAKVDVDRHQQLAQRLGAQGVPTLVLYADGQPVERLVGAQSKGQLVRLVDQYT